MPGLMSWLIKIDMTSNAQFKICITVKPTERCTCTQTNKYTWTWIQ